MFFLGARARKIRLPSLGLADGIITDLSRKLLRKP